MTDLNALEQLAAQTHNNPHDVGDGSHVIVAKRDLAALVRAVRAALELGPPYGANWDELRAALEPFRPQAGKQP